MSVSAILHDAEFPVVPEPIKENGDVIWIRAENLLVPILKMMLICMSSTMEILHNATMIDSEGSRAKPMCWPSVHREELEIFAQWMTHQQFAKTFEGFCSLLKVAHLLQATTAYGVAIDSFKSLVLSPFQKLAVSSKWPIWHWLKPAL
ncbi:hypothetical protein Moror_6049 [Moniliophthora roreri MCA 2997]|uniref:Uncharacterized protein n=1 Tax=Moniliophthora roreri (strain MCA 2997) TaxID=1381753 RepID=V2WNJ3_MONRO|nr:hypothetical protein Moror_6049 [Moniliophthora roreri MCA 2997]